MPSGKLENIKKIIGKTIQATIVRASGRERGPDYQIFLVFEDDTHYEIFINGRRWNGARTLREGGAEKIREKDDELTIFIDGEKEE